MAPYGRILNHKESDQGECGTFGFLGPRTEQFALGSLYYLISYGFEVYGDRCLAEDPYEHGPKDVGLLQNMEFPNLNGNPLIDNIIDKCWHNKYAKVSDLATHTKTLLNERTVAMESNKGKKRQSSEVANLDKTMLNERWHMAIGRLIHGIFHRLKLWCRSLLQSVHGEARIPKRVSDDNDVVDQSCLEEDF